MRLNRMMKNLCLLVAALGMLVCFAGCGGGETSHEGYYTLTVFSDPENNVEYGEDMLLLINMANDYLYLEADGTGRMVLFSEELEIGWAEEELTFTATGQSTELEFEKNQAVLDMGGLKLTYTRSEEDPPAAGDFPQAALNTEAE